MIKCHNTLQSLTDTQNLIIARTMLNCSVPLAHLLSSTLFSQSYAVKFCPYEMCVHICKMLQKIVFLHADYHPWMEKRSELHIERDEGKNRT